MPDKIIKCYGIGYTIFSAIVGFMHIDEFSKNYGTTQKRLYLINLLREELMAIVGKGWTFRAYVYGSMVNSDIDEPNDIDCLFSVSNSQCSGAWQPITNTDKVHAWPNYIRFDPAIFFSSCRGLQEMVQAFNSNNQRTGENITIEPFNCIEVTI